MIHYIKKCQLQNVQGNLRLYKKSISICKNTNNDCRKNLTLGFILQLKILQKGES